MLSTTLNNEAFHAFYMMWSVLKQICYEFLTVQLEDRNIAKTCLRADSHKIKSLGV